MSRRHHRSPVRIVAAIVGVLALAGIVAYAAKSDPAPKGAGATVGYSTPAAPRSSSLWIGDSYTAGTGATDAAHGEACLTADALGMLCGLDAEGGTGFVNNGHGAGASNQPLPARLAADRAAFPAPVLVVVDAGRNDASFSADTVRAVARKYLEAVRTAWPHARLVLIVPYYLTSTGEFGPLGSLYRSLASKLHATVVDPIRAGWIGSASARLTIADHVHPNPAGHRYIAAHLAPAIRG